MFVTVCIECGPIFAYGLLKLGQDNRNSDLDAKFLLRLGVVKQNVSLKYQITPSKRTVRTNN